MFFTSLLKNLVHKKLVFIKSFLIIFFLLFLQQPIHAENTNNDVINKYARNEIIVLGRVSQGPRRHYRAFDSLGKYLVKHLEDFGIKSFEINFPRNKDEMIQELQEGRIDFLCDTPFSALFFEREADAKIILRQWKNGTSSYQTHFITHKNSQVNHLSDLAGRKIAFEDPGSTSAFFVPMLSLKNNGLDVQLQGSSKFNPMQNTVSYTFSYSEENILYSILRGKSDAGAISNLDWIDPNQAPEGLKRDLRVFHTTPNIIRSLFLARSDISPDIEERIIFLLTKMHESEEGKKVLHDFFKVARFDQLVDDAAEDLEYARKLFAEFDY